MFLALQLSVLFAGVRGAKCASGPPRIHLIGFVAAQITVMTSILFSELSDGWPYYWAYAGLLLRVAAQQQAQPRELSALHGKTPLASPASAR